jgi:hypothetical protein
MQGCNLHLLVLLVLLSSTSRCSRCGWRRARRDNHTVLYPGSAGQSKFHQTLPLTRSQPSLLHYVVLLH